jgi:hypothetical protein
MYKKYLVLISGIFLFLIPFRINKTKLKLCIYVWLLFVSKIVAQSDDINGRDTTKDSLAACEKESKERDVVDIYRLIIKKKPTIEKCEPSKKAGKIDFAFLPAAGYSLVTKTAVVVAANAAFYADNEGDTKLSAVNTSIGYTQNNQIILPILSDIWTKKNKYNLLGDWRYYKYPEYTYGLGGHTSIKNSNQLNYSNIIIHEAILKHISGSDFCLGTAYNLNYHWDVSEAINVNNELSDFQKYGFTKKSVSSGVSLNALFDSRKNSINPSDAAYASISFCPNYTFLGSDNNYQSLLIDLRKYITFGKSENVLAFWSYDWFTFNGNAPYLDLPSTGWDAYANMGRGYIQSRLRGKNLLYLEAEYRFGITSNGLLGGVVFTNAQSVTDWPSNKFEVIYPAVGTGIRIKVNKHSNTNVCIDYGFGLNGSNGLFINLGEVF